jgi:hypothetical protein
MNPQRRHTQKRKINFRIFFVFLPIVLVVAQVRGESLRSQESLPQEIPALSVTNPASANFSDPLESLPEINNIAPDNLKLPPILSPATLSLDKELRIPADIINQEKPLKNSAEPVAPKSASSKNRLPYQINRALNALSLEAPQKIDFKDPSVSNSLFDGLSKNSIPSEIGFSDPNRAKALFIINDDGVAVSGKAAEYYQEVHRFIEEYKDKIDLAESLGVMDDSYADVWAKLKVIESVDPHPVLDHHNEHLDETLTWVDGVADIGGKRTAIYTHRVFFHPAKNPQSEIQEGIRRVNGYINETARYFEKRGKAEQALGPLDQVVLGFDTRGYKEIKDFIKTREKELQKTHGERFRFVYLDEVADVPKNPTEMRAALNTLVAQYKGNSLQKIIEGVIYSRYTGLLLELKTLEHYYKENYKILQSGREIFDENGHYVTELDAVVKSPEGVTYLVEAKSSRVLLPKERVLEGKILYKLDAYKKNQALLEKEIHAPLNVVFSMDLGIPKDSGRKHGQNFERAARQKELMEFLKAQAPILSRRYGFPVSFLFIDGSAGQN